VKRALVALGAAGLALVACASLIDIKDLRPPDATAEAGLDGDVPDASADGPRGCASPSTTEGGTFHEVANVTAVTADADTVYFVTLGGNGQDGTISSCPKCGCAGAPRTLASNLNAPVAIAVDDDYLYWIDGLENGAIHRFDKRTGDKTGDVSIPLVFPTALTLDETHVYFTTLGRDGGGNTGPVDHGIWRVERGFTQAAAPERLAFELAPFAVAVDAQYVYWGTVSNLAAGNVCDVARGSFGAIRRLPKAGADASATVTLVDKETCVIALSLDQSNVYYSLLGDTAQTGMIKATPKDSAADAGPRTLASLQTAPIAIASGNGSLYWVNANITGAVRRCALPACGTIELFSPTEAAPSSIFFDPRLTPDGSAVVFWGNSGVPGSGLGGGIRWRSAR
jgi:hypothetical protein